MDQCTTSDPNTEINIDIKGFKQEFKEILFELQRKRILLEECRQELNESILKQHDLERQLSNEKHKNTNDEYYRIILQNGAEALEEGRQKCTKELTKLKVQLELCVAERDSLRNQVRSQCLENHNLKCQVDDLSSKHRCHSGFQKDISDQLSKIKLSLHQVNDLMIPLRKKQEDLENISPTNSISEQILLSAKQFETLKIIAEKKSNELETKLIIKCAEYSKLQELLKNSPVITTSFDTNTYILDYWKATCQDLQSQLLIEKEGTEQLTNALKVCHDTEEYIRKKQIKDEEKINELQALVKSHELKIDIGTQTEAYEQIIDIVDLVKSETE